MLLATSQDAIQIKKRGFKMRWMTRRAMSARPRLVLLGVVVGQSEAAAEGDAADEFQESCACDEETSDEDHCDEVDLHHPIGGQERGGELVGQGGGS